MPETTRVRVTDGDVWVDGDHLTRGDEAEIPVSVYERIPGSFESIDDGAESASNEADADDGSATDDTAGDVEVDPHPEELTVDEIEERVAEVDSVAKLQRIRELEVESDDRTTALEVIDDRLDELEE
ncbi:hypothetical protein [Halosimplex pelagicum]|uniref:Uncharacterized protein n=1 Tax=Halosimplex pelagicum TaxID=869886 RepID=A0A7D5P765_9EURY|nr:hypothetical protein [Halosimplex pelagicum]QLH82466.1 hypothetical protein HZS54_12950 [Halosimplex pelagicum]QLH82522.1 hypothetical protein HZS54_13255 [Halosimplex pelagicum]